MTANKLQVIDALTKQIMLIDSEECGLGSNATAAEVHSYRLEKQNLQQVITIITQHQWRDINDDDDDDDIEDDKDTN